MKKIGLLLLLCFEITGMEKVKLKIPWNNSKKKSVFIPEKILGLRTEKETLAAGIVSGKKKGFFLLKVYALVQGSIIKMIL